MKTIIGLDIGGTKTAIVEGTAEAQILGRKEIPTNGHKPFNETFRRIAALVEDMIAEGKNDGRQVAAISVSVGGPLQITEGILGAPPHLAGWHGVRLKERLDKRFPALPVYIEHDGNAGALAEFHFGVGREDPGLQHLIFLTLGTGLGAGLIVNGQVVRGATDTAGEVGHLRLADRGPVGHGKPGSWEGFCSGAGMIQLAKEMFPATWNGERTIHDLVQAALLSDEEALQVVQQAGSWLGRGLAILIDTLNPQVIVLGSLAVVLEDRLLAPARRTLAEEALSSAVDACRIIPSTFAKRIGDVASLMAALRDDENRKTLLKNAGHSLR
jgi:glucokinase